MVISWKCFVFGNPSARIPNACRDSWKWRSKFFLREKHEIRNGARHIQANLPSHIHVVGADFATILNAETMQLVQPVWDRLPIPPKW